MAPAPEPFPLVRGLASNSGHQRPWKLAGTSVLIVRDLHDRRVWLIAAELHHKATDQWLTDRGLLAARSRSRHELRRLILAEHAACPMPLRDDLSGAGPRLQRVGPGHHRTPAGRYEAKRTRDGQWELSDLSVRPVGGWPRRYQTLALCQQVIDTGHANLIVERDHRTGDIYPLDPDLRDPDTDRR